MELEKGMLIWFTGVAASGKTTVARSLEKALKERGIKVENLDADEIRATLQRTGTSTPSAWPTWASCLRATACPP